MNTIKELGQDNEAMTSIRMDLIKEQDRLKKLRQKAGGKAGTAYATQKEMAKIKLKDQYAQEGRKINDAEVYAIVEAHFLRVLGEKSITGVKGSETMSIDTSPIQTPPIFQESKPTSASDRISALEKIQDLDSSTLEAVGDKYKRENQDDSTAQSMDSEVLGRQLLLESL